MRYGAPLSCLLALLYASCTDGGGGAAETALRVRIAMAGAEPTPARLTLSLFDLHRRVLDQTPVPPGGGMPRLPGDVVVLLRDDVGAVRVVVEGWNGGLVARGVGRVIVAPRTMTSVDVQLSSPPDSDRDGDGVPDSVDNCPDAPNTNQTDSDGNGVGDACQGSPPGDGGVDGGGPGCGNGSVDPGEDCDDGARNSDIATVTATCTTHCKRRAPCGALPGAEAAAVDPDTGHCYVAWNLAQNWMSAHADCRARGGMLAVIESADEEALAERLVGGVVHWIGLMRNTLAPGSPLGWVNGQPLSYVKWAPGQPESTDQRCGDMAPDGWHDALCGWPSSGNLPANAASLRAYLCEHACGNGVIEAGEQCDPPGAGCTITCQHKAPCSEAGGVVSDATGNCFFPFGTAVAYMAAMTACPTGTHIAVLGEPGESDSAHSAAAGAELWIGLRAPTTLGVFAWDVPGFAFVPDRFHGFVDTQPDELAPPQCVVMSGALGNGWRDRACTDVYVTMCERERR